MTFKVQRATMAQADEESERAKKNPPPEASRLFHWLDPLRLAQVRGQTAIAVAEWKVGQVEPARATLRRARAVAVQIEERSRPTTLAEIAMVQRKVGDRKAADLTLNMALIIAKGLDAGRVEALARVAIVQADSGDRAAVRETLNKAIQIAGAGSENGSLAQQVVSGARARVGDWEGALHAALSLNDEILRASYIEELAFEQAQTGEARNALDWAEAQTAALLRACRSLA